MSAGTRAAPRPEMTGRVAAWDQRQVAVGASATTAEESSTLRFESMEVYRAIPALLLVVFHAYQYSRDGTGAGSYVYEGTPLHVALYGLELISEWFFVLSGFLIFVPFAQATLRRRQTRSIRGYLIRRAIRILPAYYVAIGLVWTWRFGGGADQWRDLVEHLTFTHVFDRDHIFWTIGPAWALAVEVQFYVVVALLAPVVYLLCGWPQTAAGRAVLLATVPTAVGVASAAYKWWAVEAAKIPGDDWPAYYGLAAKADAFAIGMLLAVVVAVRDGRPLFGGRTPVVIRIVGIGLMIVAVAWRTESGLEGLGFYTLSAAAFALMLAASALGPRRTPWSRVLDRAPIRGLGVISYGVYLWHEPLMIELGKRSLLIHPAPDAFPTNAVVLLALSIAAGAICYWTVEQPTMQLRRLFTADGRLANRYVEEGVG